MPHLPWLLLYFAVSATHPVHAQEAEEARTPYSFDDRPTDYEGDHPDWFKMSFLNLAEDLDETLENGKSGLIVYFGQAHCAYCRAIMEENLSKPDLVEYVIRHFDVVGLDIHDTEALTAPDGATLTVKEYALRENAYLTPTLLFFGADRHKALTLRGYYPAYKMRAALEYVADGHYRTLSFRDYLARAHPPEAFDDEELNPDPLFETPPYALDRSRFPGQRPLLVVFEQPKCHACDVLHSEPLRNPLVRKRLRGFDVVQLNVFDDHTPVVAPNGERLTPLGWAVRLGLFYTPTLLFFDEHGEEVIRIDSVVQFYRLASVLRFVAEKGYREEPNFQQWKFRHAREESRAVEAASTQAQPTAGAIAD